MQAGKDIHVDPGRRSVTYNSGLMGSTTLTGSTNVPRSSSSLVRQRSQVSQNFVHDSYNASLDFPTYIPWQTLSSDVNDKLRQGSIIINRSNRVEWADTINEETEKAPLLHRPPAADLIESGRSMEKTDPDVQTGVNWKVAAFLLVNAALGAGVLNYPAAYDRIGGIVIATILQLLLVVVLAATMFVLIYCADQNNDGSYHDVLLTMCGKRSQQISAASIMLTCYGVSITFLIIIGDQYDRLFVSHLSECVWYIDRRFTITVTAVLLILPMCYSQRLDFLKYAGTLGVFSMFYVVFLNIYQYSVLEVREEDRNKPSTATALSMVAIIPVFCFAYQCHEVVVPVYACMQEKQRNMKDFGKTTALTLLILFILYSTAGTFGYLTFGSSVSSDIMQNYDAKDPLVVIGIIALVVKMITTYPPMIVCGRGAFDGLYAEFCKLPAEEFIAGESRRRIVISTMWFFSSLAIAIFTPNIGVVIELLGSLASVNVFIFPSLCLISLANRKKDQLSRCWRYFFYAFSVTLIVLGVITFAIVLMQVYEDLQISASGPTHDVLCK